MSEEKSLALKGDSGLMSAEDLVSGLTNAKSVVDDSGDGIPFIKLGRAGEGWMFGQDGIEVEEGSVWVMDPRTAQYGWTGFSADPQPGGKKLKKGEREGPFNVLVSIKEPFPDKPEQPAEAETVIDFKKSYSVQFLCVTGEDAGTMVKYAPTSVGGTKEMRKMFAKLEKRIQFLQSEGKDISKFFPAVMLNQDSYQNKNYGGTTFVPVLDIVRWTDARLSDFKIGQSEPETETEKPAPKKRAAKAEVIETTATEVEDEDDEDTDDEPQPVRRRRRRRAS